MQNPLHLHHEKMGATFDDRQVPLRYTSVDEEYWTVRKAAGMADLSHLGRLTISGKDKVAFLNGLLTNDITKLKENDGVHSVLLNTKARVLADLYLYSQGDQVIVDTSNAPASRVKTILDQFIITEDVKVEDSSENLLILTIQGPSSAQSLKGTLGIEVNDLRPLQCRSLGPSLIIARDRTGWGGYDILVPRDEAEAVWGGFLLKAAEFGLGPVGSGAIEILRLEKGLPRYGVDVDENTIVLEAGYEDAISFTKGCYMGQEVVARATHIGRVNRRLSQVQVDTDSSPEPKSQLSADGKEVGFITSSAFSPGLGKIIGLGYVQRDFASEGRRLTALVEGKEVQAMITKIV